MMYPILCKVRYESLNEILVQPGIWKQIFFSIFANWVLAPFLMVRPMPVLLCVAARPRIADGTLD
jgi:ACR3 family arsenite efflux pump ArsB